MTSQTRNFSALGNYQQAHTLSYSVESLPIGQQLSVSKHSAAGTQTDSVLVVVPKQDAETAMQYLYENSISMEHWRDVLADLLPGSCLCP